MEYKDIMKMTIAETFPNYTLTSTLKKLVSQNIISYKEELMTSLHDTYVFTNEDGTPYTPLFSTEELFAALDHKENEVIEVIQEQDYVASYSYSTLFTIDGDWLGMLQDRITEGEILSCAEQTFVRDELSETIEGNHPTYVERDGIHILKFALKLTGFLPRERDNRRVIIYPILCLLNPAENSLEIRFNKVKSFISTSVDGFYPKKVNEIKSKIEDLLSVELTAVNLSPIIKYINEIGHNEIAVSAQAIALHTGSKATLDTGSNDNMILPFIGNLKGILQEHKELFDSNEGTQTVKDLLEEIILEAEYLSDHPWITLAWVNEVKSKVLKIKFLFNYQGQDFSVLQYYGNIADSERMSYVTQFIFDEKRKLESEPE